MSRTLPTVSALVIRHLNNDSPELTLIKNLIPSPDRHNNDMYVGYLRSMYLIKKKMMPQ